MGHTVSVFLIRKEPVALTQAAPLEACALIGLHLRQQKMRLDQAAVSLRIWETCGNAVAHTALTGKATLRHGRKEKALLHLSSEQTAWKSLALNVVGQDQSGEKISLFLEDWELAWP